MPFVEMLVSQIDGLVEDRFSIHPFSVGISKDNFPSLIGNYLAMSIAFPYLQAGAQSRVITECIRKEKDVTKEIEVTVAVGAFLTWDEVGGHAIVQQYGNEGLPKILGTQGFHYNLLRSDIKHLLGKEIPPMYAQETKEYLKRLEYGLSTFDPVTRVANMVAFEKHAGIMIDSLWNSITSLFSTNKESLSYFYTHVGGEDPAEAYHIQMTKRMIQNTISENDAQRFVDYFSDAYALNYNWCESIKHLAKEVDSVDRK